MRRSSSLSTNEIRCFASFILGLCITIYTTVIGPIKVVDVAVVFALVVVVPAGKQPPLYSYWLAASVLSVFISTLIGVVAMNVGQSDVVEALLSGLGAVLAFFVVCSMRSRELVWFLRGFLATSVVISVIIMLETFQMIGEILPRYRSIFGASPLGFMPDPNRFGLALVIAASLILGAILSGYKRKIAVIAMVPVVFTVGLLGQRSVIVVFLLISIAAVMLYLSEKGPFLSAALTRVKRAFRVIALPGSMLMLSFVVVSWSGIGMGVVENSSIYEKFMDRGISYAEDPRYQKLMAGLDAATRKPLFGHGVEGYVRVAESGTSHNSYIEIFVSGGFVGLFAFTIFLFLAAKNSWNWSEYSDPGSLDRAVGAGKLLCLIVIMAYMAVLNVHYLIFAYAILGFIVNKYRKHSF